MFHCFFFLFISAQNCFWCSELIHILPESAMSRPTVLVLTRPRFSSSAISFCDGSLMKFFFSVLKSFPIKLRINSNPSPDYLSTFRAMWYASKGFKAQFISFLVISMPRYKTRITLFHVPNVWQGLDANQIYPDFKWSALVKLGYPLLLIFCLWITLAQWSLTSLLKNIAILPFITGQTIQPINYFLMSYCLPSDNCCIRMLSPIAETKRKSVQFQLFQSKHVDKNM